MNDATWNAIFGQEKPTKRPKLVRKRIQLTEKNNKFLEYMEEAGCDSNTLVNMALNVFIPKTYNNNFNLEAIVKGARNN